MEVTMRYLQLLVLSAMLLLVNAQEISKEQFPYLLPISVEKIDINSDNSFFADTDADGVGDDKDKCPNTPRNKKVDLFGCVLLDDDDNDGVGNLNDQCPNTREGATVNLVGCEPDNDEDGVADALDECPYTTQDFIVDNIGCPKASKLKITFKPKEFSLSDDTLVEVENFANFLLDNAEYQAIIYGYTDNSSEVANKKELSQKRANALMNALINFGVKLTNLTAIGMGDQNPIADNDTPEGRAKNRRIEVELLQ